MKKILLILGILLSVNLARAGLPEWNYPARSSFTAIQTPGPILFSSAPVLFQAIVVSSPSAGSITLFKSTSAAYFNTIATQTFISTSENDVFPMFNTTNSSYTYINKLGVGTVTIFFNCVGRSDQLDECPGLLTETR